MKKKKTWLEQSQEDFDSGKKTKTELMLEMMGELTPENEERIKRLSTDPEVRRKRKEKEEWAKTHPIEVKKWQALKNKYREESIDSD